MDHARGEALPGRTYVLLAVDSIKWSDGGSSWRHTPPMLFYLSSSPSPLLISLTHGTAASS
jgi:hypothetical protein